MLFFAACLYSLIAFLFVVETYNEGRQSLAAWDAWRLSGLALGLIWPLHLLGVIAAVVWTGRSSAAGTRSGD